MGFLKIIGLILLFVVIVIAVIYLYFYFKFNKYAKYANPADPLTINLTEDPSSDYLDKKQVKKVSETLKSLGFTAGRSYIIDEMVGMSIRHFYKQDMNAVLYYHAMYGVWMDFIFNNADGKEYTFTNAPEFATQGDSRPECIRYANHTLTVNELYNKAKEVASQQSLVVFPPEEFKQNVEMIYKKDIAWRVRKGGVTFEEFNDVAKTSKDFKHLSAEKLNEGFIQHKLQELIYWHSVALIDYAETHDIPNAADNILFFEDHFILPKKAHIPSLLSYLEQNDFISSQQLEKMNKAYNSERTVNADNTHGPNAYDLFDEANALLPTAKQAQLLSDHDFPLTLRIYRKVAYPNPDATYRK